MAERLDARGRSDLSKEPCWFEFGIGIRVRN
jgi:hypothetical protein